jgi:hypothetical protein
LGTKKGSEEAKDEENRSKRNLRQARGKELGEKAKEG